MILLTIWLWASAARPRLLPPSKYPGLPAPLIQALEKRGCQIPQLERRNPDNVIRGSFFKADQTDWAVLCTTTKVTELLVFADGSADKTTTIASSPNGFSAWAIGPIAAPTFPSEIEKTALKADHLGIRSFVYFRDSAEGETLYFHEGRWIHVSGVSVN